MFGWEFPPHILGGLGTASYGLTKGMWECGDMDITFVIPKPFGDEERHFANIIGMSQVPVVWRDVNADYVRDRIGNVMSPDLYYRLRDHIYADFSYMRTNDLGCIEFSAGIPTTSWRRSTTIRSAPAWWPAHSTMTSSTRTTG